MTLFTSKDSRHSLKTAFLITIVPVLMLLMAIYSIWMIMVMNHSFFVANGFPLGDESLSDFFDYVLQSQIEYIPFLGFFIIIVFFVGILVSHIILRPFHQLTKMCQDLKEGHEIKTKISGLEKQKLLIKLGYFLSDIAKAKTHHKSIEVPDDLRKVKGPIMDKVFYFQFLCVMFIISVITITSLYIFTYQLFDSVVVSGISILKSSSSAAGIKGMSYFFDSQKSLIDYIIIIPSVISIILYLIIARLLITNIQGVTYAYVRDICDAASGQSSKRIRPREDDPGKEAADAVNLVLDQINTTV